MNITEDWFYKLSELSASEITVWGGIGVVLFDDLNSNVDISLWENSKVEFYSVLEQKEDFRINFIQDKQNSNLKVRYLILSKNEEKVKAQIYSELASNNSKSDVKIISIIWKDWFVDLDWIIKIEKGIEKVEANLIEENLFLWSSGKIKGIPTLLVRSDDVKASHACKMEKISDEELFYLRSRGIAKQDSLNMILEAKIVDLFGNLDNIDTEFYKELKENILTQI